MEWISVIDKMPTPSSSDIIIFDGNIVATVCYLGTSGFLKILPCDKIKEFRGVTHWMPLPEPPTD